MSGTIETNAPTARRPVPWGTAAAQVLFTILAISPLALATQGVSTFPIPEMVAWGGSVAHWTDLTGVRSLLVDGDYLHMAWGMILPWSGLLVLAGAAFAYPFAAFFFLALARGRRPGPWAEGISWAVCLAAVVRAWPDPVPSMLTEGRLLPSLAFWEGLLPIGLVAVVLGGLTASLHAAVGAARRRWLSIGDEIVLVAAALLGDRFGVAGVLIPLAAAWVLRGEVLLTVALAAGDRPLGARALGWAAAVFPNERTRETAEAVAAARGRGATA